MSNEPLNQMPAGSTGSGPGGELSFAERAELERLRAQVAASGRSRWTRAGRWTAAWALLLVSALLGVLAVVAVYLKSEVLDTETYVQTVAPLAQDTAVRQAVTDRLTEVIVTRADIQGLATQLAQRLVAEGAPQRIEDLVGPAVNGLTSFLSNEIYKLLGTEQFQQIWEQVNRAAHQGVVTVLTGGQGQLLTSSGTTVTIDLGALLSAAKERLAARGMTLVSRIPDISIPYELIDSDQLPTLRTYTKLLNSAGTWLPFVALALFIGGVLAAPNRRRGLLIGTVLLGLFTAVTLAALSVARTYYLDNLPSSVRSPDAAAAVINTVLRYLFAALQTLLAAALVALVVVLLAGPSTPAIVVRRLINVGLDAGARGLAGTGSWVSPVGRVLAGARSAILIILVLAAIVGLILAERPSIAAVLWTTIAVLLVAAVMEILVRAARMAPKETVPAAHGAA